LVYQFVINQEIGWRVSISGAFFIVFSFAAGYDDFFVLSRCAMSQPAWRQWYQDHSQNGFIMQTIEQRLLAHLSLMTLAPKRLLDVACGLGDGLCALKARYPAAVCFGVDWVHRPLLTSAKRVKDDGPFRLCQAKAQALPFSTACMDLVYTNLCLLDHQAMDHFFSEVARVLRPGGVFLFSSLGPDTFEELFARGPKQALTSPWLDMHNVGDQLLAHGLQDPVMETEALQLRYTSLKAAGMDLAHSGFLCAKPWRAYDFAYEATQAPIQLSLSCVYGHAWQGERTPISSDPLQGHIVPSAIKRRTIY
jgi:malonyl-CoA O-methyltransferase